MKTIAVEECGAGGGRISISWLIRLVFPENGVFVFTFYMAKRAKWWYKVKREDRLWAEFIGCGLTWYIEENVKAKVNQKL